MSFYIDDLNIINSSNQILFEISTEIESLKGPTGPTGSQGQINANSAMFVLPGYDNIEITNGRSVITYSPSNILLNETIIQENLINKFTNEDFDGAATAQNPIPGIISSIYSFSKCKIKIIHTKFISPDNLLKRRKSLTTQS